MKVAPPSARSVSRDLAKESELLRKELAKYLEEPTEDRVHDVRAVVRRIVITHKALPKSARREESLREYVTICRRFYRANALTRDLDILRAKLQGEYGLPKEDPLIFELAQKRVTSLAKARKLAESLKGFKPSNPSPSDIRDSKLKNRYRRLIRDLGGQLKDDIPVVLSDATEVRRLHEVRKDFKELRYLLGMSSDQERLAPALKELTDLHNLLGSIHDDDITMEYLGKTGNSGRNNVRNQVVSHRKKNYERLVRIYGARLGSESSFLLNVR